MNNICIISFKILDMSIGGWILTFIISCFSSYVMLLHTIKKEKERYRKDRNEKLAELKRNIYHINDWCSKVRQNIINLSFSNPLDIPDIPLSKEFLIVALQTEELKEEYSTIIEITNEINIIENYCIYKRYLNSNSEREQLLGHLKELSTLVRNLKNTPIDIQKKDVENEKIEIEDFDLLISKTKEKNNINKIKRIKKIKRIDRIRRINKNIRINKIKEINKINRIKKTKRINKIKRINKTKWLVK